LYNFSGDEKKTNVMSNMEQYHLDHLFAGTVRFDMAKNDVFHFAKPMFDAIMTDRTWPLLLPILIFYLP